MTAVLDLGVGICLPVRRAYHGSPPQLHGGTRAAPTGGPTHGVGGTTSVGVDLSGNTRVGLKVRQLTQLRRSALDTGLGALLFESRGGIGATAHVGVNVKRHFGLRLSADVVDRPGGSLAVAYIGGSVAKLSSRLSPIEGMVGAVLPLIMILVNLIQTSRAGSD